MLKMSLSEGKSFSECRKNGKTGEAEGLSCALLIKAQLKFEKLLHCFKCSPAMKGQLEARLEYISRDEHKQQSKSGEEEGYPGVAAFLLHFQFTNRWG